MIDGPKEVVIDDLRFKIYPMGCMKALLLDRKIISMLVPLISGFKDDLEAEVDFKVISEGFQKSLTEMSDAEYKSLVLDLLKDVTIRPKNPKPGEGESLSIDESVMNSHFEGKLMTIYKLIIEVMKFNKFTPFEMVAGGIKMNQITSLIGSKKNTKKTGK